MSVLAKDRKLSQYQFYISAIKLRKSLVELLLRDFGVKHKARELGVRVRKMDEETHKRFVNLATKYGMPTELAAYPAWMASAAKDTIENSLRVWTADMTDEERDEFLDIALSYSMTCITTEYPGWLVQKLRDIITRERRKLKKLAKKVMLGEITLTKYREQYKSWRGDKKAYHAYHTLQNMDQLYKECLQWITKHRKNNRKSLTSDSNFPATCRTLATTKS